ncbi:MAG: hypothetical protein QM729_17590 [Solirubrobacterales bacterium]
MTPQEVQAYAEWAGIEVPREDLDQLAAAIEAHRTRIAAMLAEDLRLMMLEPEAGG